MIALADKLAYKFGGRNSEDLAQDLKILGWIQRKRGDHPYSIRKRMKWKALNYYRRIRWERERFLGLEGLVEPAKPIEPLTHSLWKLTEGLPAELKPLASLAAQGYTVREIAVILKISPSSVSRVQETLREILV